MKISKYKYPLVILLTFIASITVAVMMGLRPVH